jgi:hypothetical protein
VPDLAPWEVSNQEPAWGRQATSGQSPSPDGPQWDTPTCSSRANGNFGMTCPTAPHFPRCQEAEATPNSEPGFGIHVSNSLSERPQSPSHAGSGCSLGLGLWTQSHPVTKCKCLPRILSRHSSGQEVTTARGHQAPSPFPPERMPHASSRLQWAK